MANSITITDTTKQSFTFFYNEFFDKYASKMPSSAFMTYLALKRHANFATGECFPSRARLAKLIGVSVNTIGKSLNILEDLKLVKIVNRTRDDGGFTSSLITLIDPPSESDQPPSQKLPTPLVKNCLPPRQILPTSNKTEMNKTEMNGVTDVHTSVSAPEKPPSSPEQAIVQAYCQVAGIPQPANYGKAIGHAKGLLKVGVTVEDIPSLFEAANWGDGPDLGKMVLTVERWRARQTHAPKVPIEQLPPSLKARYDSVVLDRTGRGKSIHPLPDQLQKDIDDWKRSKTV